MTVRCSAVLYSAVWGLDGREGDDKRAREGEVLRISLRYISRIDACLI